MYILLNGTTQISILESTELYIFESDFYDLSFKLADSYDNIADIQAIFTEEPVEAYTIELYNNESIVKTYNDYCISQIEDTVTSDGVNTFIRFKKNEQPVLV